MSKSIKMPKSAEKTIEQALEEFLDEQRARLKAKTMNNYDAVIGLFKSSMNNYAYTGLDKAEGALFEQLYHAKGTEHREFCQIFGPEKIPENVGEFLDYFMVRKVMCGKELMQAAGAVTKKLGKWLSEKGYLNPEQAQDVVERGADAAKTLPATEDLASMLAEYCDRTAGQCDDVLEDYFTIERIESGRLHLSDLTGEGEIVVPVSRSISDACRVGWTISGAVGKTRKGWRLLEAWNVYP